MMGEVPGSNSLQLFTDILASLPISPGVGTCKACPGCRSRQSGLRCAGPQSATHADGAARRPCRQELSLILMNVSKRFGNGAAAGFFIALITACSSNASLDYTEYEREIKEWRAARLESVAGEEGWATLVGLLWLSPGVNSFGRAPDNNLVLDYPALPAHVGSFQLDGRRIEFEAADGAKITSGGEPVIRAALETDEEGNPTRLETGSLNFFLIRRGNQVGIRVKDRAAERRRNFKGLQYFDIDPRWRLPARFEPHTPVTRIPIANVIGMVEMMDSPGTLLFMVDGRTYRLDTVQESGEADYFVMFGDRTNGEQTYGGGRFLYVKPPVDGLTVIDFNKAYNPPCAFSNFATCPIPPAHNRLSIPVTAGELKYADSTH